MIESTSQLGIEGNCLNLIMYIYKNLQLRHQVCGHLLWQPQETNTEPQGQSDMITYSYHAWYTKLLPSAIKKQGWPDQQQAVHK